MKNIVKEGYNKIAEKYIKKRDNFKNKKYLEKLNKLLKPGSLILDIGCGAGKPIDEFFITKGHKIIGIDISEKQIELARKNVPQGKFEVKDMLKLRKGEYNVDAVVSFYSIFHVPKETHEELFRKIRSFLPKGGLVLVTMGSTEYEGIEKNFHGLKMFWSHYGIKRNREIVEKAGFEILLDVVDTSGGERHQIILAKNSVLKIFKYFLSILSL